MALGRGFQAYFPQKRDGSIRKWQMKTMADIAKFCRERQHFCHRAKPVPQIGLIYSGEAMYRKLKKLFGPWHGEIHPMWGILHSLLDAQNVVDVVMEHHLINRMHQYPLLIFLEWEYVDPQFKKDLLNYVENGGNLLIIDPKAVTLFEKELGVKLLGEPEEKVNGLKYNGHIAGVKSLFQQVELGDRVRACGKIYENNDIFGNYEIAASITQYGKGKLAATYLNLGERYFNATTSVSRDFLNALVRELFPEPIVEVQGSHYVDVTLNQKNGKLAIVVYAT